jgi:hypothetical protein
MNDTVKLIAVGYLVLVASLVAEFLASIALSATGLIAPNATGSTWFWAVTWMMVLSSPLVFAASYGAAARLMKVQGVAEAWPMGLIWVGIVGLTHLLIGLGNATLGMFASPGTYLMLAAVGGGAWLAGRAAETRPA